MKRNILLIMFLGLLVSVSAQDLQNAELKTYLDEYRIGCVTDAGDYLWMTDGKSIIKFNKQTGIVTFYLPDNIEMSPDYFINSITCDDNGLPIVGARYTGVLRMNENEEWMLLPPVNAEQLKIYGGVILLLTNNNVLWTTVSGLNTFPNMLVKYQGDEVETFSTEVPLTSLAEDKEGNLWIGRMDGGLILGNDHYESLVKFDGENWTTFSSPLEMGPPPFRIHGITFNEQGNIWMVGYFGLLDNWETKLIKFDDPEWHVYDLPVKASIKSIALQEDSVIWLGTSEGLMRFSDSKWTVFNTENSGLPSKIIYSVVIDNDGIIWLGTRTGLVAFNRTDADEGSVVADTTGITLSFSDDSGFTSEIELFPNPARDLITLEIPGELQNTTVNILNIQGCLIKSIKVDNTRCRVDVSHLPAGVYLVRIQSGERQILKKFVKK